MNNIRTMKSNYKVTFQLRNNHTNEFFFETLKAAKFYRNELCNKHDLNEFIHEPKLIMLCSNKYYDFFNSLTSDKWI